MKKYIREDEWCIIEDSFDPHLNKISESLFSIGNGKIGQRANFEEHYSGESLQGNYVAGIYYPDKTRVGWWKNGYPEYFAKIINAANWIGIDITIQDQRLDLATAKILKFERVLNMREGFLKRTFIAELPDGKQIEVRSTRFCSIAQDEIGAIRYELKALNFEGDISINSFIDGDVRNQDSNYDEKFWDEVAFESDQNKVLLTLSTRKTNFHVCTGSITTVFLGTKDITDLKLSRRDKYAGLHMKFFIRQNQKLTIHKYAAILSSENYPSGLLLKNADQILEKACDRGFDNLLAEQATAWNEKWRSSDIIIEGDLAAQQAIRFNIFHLNQTYTGKDPRLNIGPKGFTGEKYGGLTYWDTEAYCVPYYLGTADQEVARNLLIYRYRHLGKAIENAEKLGFKNGAALFPMVTINGEECHNEWEITFEEIHRNGAIAFAIYNYVRYTGDESYLAEFGLEVLVAISRFWAQRVNKSSISGKYMILGVTGPNEYENNINNNWYTNKIASWCLNYSVEVAQATRKNDPATFSKLQESLSLGKEELDQWLDIANHIYLPECREQGIFLQQDGYLDKEQVLVADLDTKHRPLNQKWSWDRILRSCFIKQADVLQGLYFFEDEYSLDVIKNNFDFYEARTVHESSLSPCIHSILAARLNDEKKAYEFYLRTARLDLDDYNNDTEDGLHITSMAGTWMSVTEGFAGMKVREGRLILNPFLPEMWKSFTFTINFRDSVLRVKVGKETVNISNLSEKPVHILVHGTEIPIPANDRVTTEYNLKV